MINVKRLGHATFETPDLERQIEYFRQIVGLGLVEREADRAFLATETGQLAVVLQKGPVSRTTKLAFEISPQASITDMQPSSRASTSTARPAATPARRQDLAALPGSQGHDDRTVLRVEFRRQRRSGGGRRGAAQARPSCLRRAGSSGRRGLVSEGARFPDVGLDRRLFRVHALQSGPPHGELHPRARAMRGCTTSRSSCVTRPPAERMRPARPQEGGHHLGAGAPRPGPQRRHLSPQSGRSGDRALHRPRPHVRRRAGLFRAAALASDRPQRPKSGTRRAARQVGPAAGSELGAADEGEVAAAAGGPPAQQGCHQVQAGECRPVRAIKQCRSVEHRSVEDRIDVVVGIDHRLDHGGSLGGERLACSAASSASVLRTPTAGTPK